MAGPEPEDIGARVDLKGLDDYMDDMIDGLLEGNPLKGLKSIDVYFDTLKALVDIFPDDALLQYQLGTYGGKPISNVSLIEGVERCWIASRLSPGWGLPLVEIGILYLNVGKNEEARDHLESIADRVNDCEWHYMYNLGVARFRCKDFLPALKALERTVALDPSHAQALDYAAECAFRLGDRSRGMAYAKQANALGVSDTYEAWRKGAFRKSPRSR